MLSSTFIRYFGLKYLWRRKIEIFSGVSRTRRRIALGLVASRKFRRTGDMLGTAPGGKHQPQTSDGEDIRLTDHRARVGLSVSRWELDTEEKLLIGFSYMPVALSSSNHYYRKNNVESRKQQEGTHQVHYDERNWGMKIIIIIKLQPVKIRAIKVNLFKRGQWPGPIIMTIKVRSVVSWEVTCHLKECSLEESCLCQGWYTASHFLIRSQDTLIELLKTQMMILVSRESCEGECCEGGIFR